MNSIREIQRLNKLELEQGIPPSASWHVDYRDTAYVHVGGLPFDLTEGDILTIFSQFGEPTFVKLQRDKTTGKSRGFGWVKYEDQRSCDLAVDNLGGATVLGRVLKVDHTRYQKRDDESEEEGDGAPGVANGKGPRAPSVESEEDRPRRPLLKEEIELQKLLVEHDAEDPMKQYLIDEKKAEVEQTLERQRRDADRSGKSDRQETGSRRHRDRSAERATGGRRRSDSEDSYDRERRHRQRQRRFDGISRKDRREDRGADRTHRARDIRSQDEYEDDHRQRRRVQDADRDHTPDSSRRRRDHGADNRARDRTPVRKHGQRDRSAEVDDSRRRHRQRTRSRSP